MLKASELHFAYSAGKPILRGAALELPPGSMTAIIGPNGAGKSTLLRLLVGVLRPGMGRVELDGQPLAGLSHRERARTMAYVPQKTSLAFAYSVRQYVALGRYSIAGGGDDAAVQRALEKLELTARAEDPLPELSAGQQQRAALARALAQLDHPAGAGTRALLADEPVSAMDPLHAHQTMEILHGQAGQGMAVGIVLHDLTLALRWCDRAVVLAGDGTIAASGATGGVLTPEVLEATFGIRFVRLEAPGGVSALVPAPL